MPGRGRGQSGNGLVLLSLSRALAPPLTLERDPVVELLLRLQPLEPPLKRGHVGPFAVLQAELVGLESGRLGLDGLL